MRTAVGSGAVLSLGAALVGPAAPAAAATFSVTSTDDAGPGSLRQAILDADATPGDDVITFAPALGPITLTSGPLSVTDGLAITGPGADLLTISGGGASRIFEIATPDAVTISGVTLADGLADAAGAVGGAIRATDADLALDGVTVRDSFGSVGGGGIAVTGGSLSLVDSLVTGNGALDGEATVSGAGILAESAEVAITDSTVSDNSTGGFYGYGGGLSAIGSATTVVGSTFSGNYASRRGGAVMIEGGTLRLGTSTVQGNRALFGGGVATLDAGAGIDASTITENAAFYGGGGVLADGAASTLTVTTSTLSDNVNDFGTGGGLAARGILEVTVERSTASGNSAGGGGGLSLDADTVTVSASTISGNTANAGAGLTLTGGTVRVTSSTISGNTAGFQAGGVQVFGTDAATIAHSTITANDVDTTPDGGGGLLVLNDAVHLDHTIVGANTASGTDADVGGQGTSASLTMEHSLVEAPPAGLAVTDGGGNVTGLDPKLHPLANTGGPTLTHALMPGSPAGDAGDPGFSPPPATDQRGRPRVSGPAIDIGAVERQAVPTLVPLGAAIVEGDTGSRVLGVPVRLTIPSSDPVTVEWRTLDELSGPTAGVDYVSASGTITFAAGQTQQTVPLTVLGDVEDEALLEWVPIALSNAVGARIGGFYGIGFGVIIDDDPAPQSRPARPDRSDLGLLDHDD